MTEKQTSVLCITYIDFDSAQSGSSVRPQSMYRAFEECGCTVKLLSGQQNRRGRRRAAVRETLDWLKTNKPDICYVESPTGPVFNTIDHRLLKRVRAMGIPIGLFYRDAYWKYGLVRLGKGLLPVLKAIVIRAMQTRDLRLFKKRCDIIYLPSELAAQEWGFENPTVLPPGCTLPELVAVELAEPRAIYVGGVNRRYGVYMLLDAFKRVNNGETCVTLTLVCREKEWAALEPEYRALADEAWLDVKHANGNALSALYQKASFAMCTLQKDAYNDLAVPIKLLEYVAYGKPVIGSDCTELSRFIESNNVGIVTAFDAAAIADAIVRLGTDDELRQRLADNCLVAREKHAWTQRAGQVVRELSGIKYQRKS